MSEPEQTHFAVITVGASAGGLDALQRLLAPLPAGFPVPIVVVQHLSPSHASYMAHILRRTTDLAVKQAETRDVLTAGYVYIAPPDHHVVFAPDGSLALSETERVHFVRPSVNVLFESAARVFGRRAIAVILTGAGQDGATGLRAVKEAGGVTVVQDPRTAAHASMPEFAVATESVDYIAALDDIPALLLNLVTRGGS